MSRGQAYPVDVRPRLQRTTCICLKPITRHALHPAVIMEQLEDPLGAAVTLSNLLSTNEDLLRRFVSPELVGDFARMIRDLGPQERLINFLEAICDVEGRPIKSNQVLRCACACAPARLAMYSTC